MIMIDESTSAADLTTSPSRRGPRSFLFSSNMRFVVALVVAVALGISAFQFGAGRGVPNPVPGIQMVFMDRALGETAIDSSVKSCYAELVGTGQLSSRDLLTADDRAVNNLLDERCRRPQQVDLITIADLDNDMLADVVTLNAAGALSVFWNRGWGFTAAPLPTMGDVQDGRGQLISGHFDSDNLVDLLLVASNGTVTLVRGTGKRTFGEPAAVATFSVTSTITSADIDGDGNLDLVGASEDGDNLVWLPGGPYGPTGSSRALLRSDVGGITALRPVDLDKDGDMDLVAAGDGGMQVWENDNMEWFDITPGGVDAHRWVRDVVATDHDGDGRLDLYTTGVRPGAEQCLAEGLPCRSDVSPYRMVWEGTRSGFRPAQSVDDNAPTWGRALTVTDLNLDGLPDLVSATGSPAAGRLDRAWPGASTKPTLLLGDGATFRDGLGDIFRILHFNGSMSMVASVDFDADTRPDLLFTGEENTAPYVYLNRSAGHAALIGWSRQMPGDLVTVSGGGRSTSYVTGGTVNGLHLGPVPAAVGLGAESANIRVQGSSDHGFTVRSGQHLQLG